MEQEGAAVAFFQEAASQETTPHEGVMPIPFPGTYDTLLRGASKGAAVPFDGHCRRCNSIGSFIFVGWFVKRGAVIHLGVSTCRYTILEIPLARCEKCGLWARVLPVELLPRKTYGMRVIQQAISRYLASECGLREAVKGIVVPPEYAPRHSSLWR
jgi:hypothetical protein